MGSVVTPWQTSVSSEAVISLISLCLTAGKHPVSQVRACLTLNGCPQLQWDGVLKWPTIYLSERLSLKVACEKQSRAHQWGSAVQVEAPFSWESSIECWRGNGRLSWRFWASSFCFICWILLLILSWTEWQLFNQWSWLIIQSTRGALICCDTAHCSFAKTNGFFEPRPPSLASSASSSRVSSSGGGYPVSAGMKHNCIAFSRDSKVPLNWSSSQSVTLKR